MYLPASMCMQTYIHIYIYTYTYIYTYVRPKYPYTPLTIPTYPWPPIFGLHFKIMGILKYLKHHNIHIIRNISICSKKFLRNITQPWQQQPSRFDPNRVFMAILGSPDLLPYIYELSQYHTYLYGTILFQQQIFISYFIDIDPVHSQYIKPKI